MLSFQGHCLERRWLCCLAILLEWFCPRNALHLARATHATHQQPLAIGDCVSHSIAAENKGCPLIVTQSLMTGSWWGAACTNCTTFLVQNRVRQLKCPICTVCDSVCSGTALTFDDDNPCNIPTPSSLNHLGGLHNCCVVALATNKHFDTRCPCAACDEPRHTFNDCPVLCNADFLCKHFIVNLPPVTATLVLLMMTILTRILVRARNTHDAFPQP